MMINKHISTQHTWCLSYVLEESHVQRRTDAHWYSSDLFWEVLTQTHHRMAAILCDWHWQWIHRDCNSDFPISFPSQPSRIITTDNNSRKTSVKIGDSKGFLFVKARACSEKRSELSKKDTLNRRIHKQTNTQMARRMNAWHVGIQNDQLRLHSIIQADGDC